MIGRHATTASALALCVLLGGCEREVELGDGYRLWDVDWRPTSLIIDKDNHVVVDPHVGRFKVTGSYVLGERQDRDDLDPRYSKKFGYFTLDKQTGQLQEGLDWEAFESALKAAGIDPSAFQ